MSSNGYREFYEQKIGCGIPKNWHIHHIDHDRENNEFYNLIALPDFIHQSFHFYKSFYPRSIFFKYAIDGRLNGDSMRNMIFTLEAVQDCKFLEDSIMMGHYDNVTPALYDDKYAEIKETISNQ